LDAFPHFFFSSTHLDIDYKSLESIGQCFVFIADPGTGRVCFRTNDTECFDLIEDKRRFVAKDSAAKNITIFRS